ncbi:MAG: GumC family protein [Pseudomonadota bacterium]
MKDDQKMSLRDTLNIIYRRIFVLKFLVVALPLATLLVCYLVTPRYESTAKVMVTAKKETATLLQGPTETGSSAFINLNVDETDLNSESELLRSLELWIRTVKKLGLNYFEKPEQGGPEAWKEDVSKTVKSWVGTSTADAGSKDSDVVEVRTVAKSLLADFKVTPAPKSKILDLTFRYSDPKMAQNILATHLDMYIPYHLEVYSLPNAQGFFSGQGDIYKKKLDDAEAELKAFKRKWGISFAERQKSESIGQIKQLQDSLVELQSNLSQYDEMQTALKEGMLPTGQLSPSMQRGSENTVINVIVTQLLRAKQRRMKITDAYSTDSREARNALEMEEALRKQLSDAVNNEVAIIKAKHVSLRESLQHEQAKLKDLEGRTEEARSLQMTANLAKERYLQYVAKEEEARLENLKGGNKLVSVRVVSKPFAATAPYFPKPLLFVFGAFVAAFPLGLGLILLANFFDHTFYDQQEVEAETGYRVLATVGRIGRDAPKK